MNCFDYHVCAAIDVACMLTVPFLGHANSYVPGFLAITESEEYIAWKILLQTAMICTEVELAADLLWLDCSVYVNPVLNDNNNVHV